jgi:hypothetical protein
MIGRNARELQPIAGSACGPVQDRCQPVRVRRDPPRVFLVTLICSDERCAAEQERLTDDLGELEAASCPCGCTLVPLTVAEWAPAPAPVLARTR